MLKTTMTCSMKRLVLKENSTELISMTIIQKVHHMHSRQYQQTYHHTFMDCITTIILETFQLQMHSEETNLLNLKLNLDSLSSVNGKLIGLKVSTCTPDIISSKMRQISRSSCLITHSSTNMME